MNLLSKQPKFEDKLECRVLYILSNWLSLSNKGRSNIYILFHYNFIFNIKCITLIKSFIFDTNTTYDILIEKWFKSQNNDKTDDEIEEEPEGRLLWMVGSFCMIFSRSTNKWCLGKIHDIRGELQDEWLIIKYNHFKKTKQIQRNSTFLKPLPLDNPLSFQKGLKCKIRSDETGIWCNGQIIDIFSDLEGEWLKVKYTENRARNKHYNKICDIQRYSEHLKPFNVPKSIKGINYYHHLQSSNESISWNLKLYLIDNKCIYQQKTRSEDYIGDGIWTIMDDQTLSITITANGKFSSQYTDNTQIEQTIQKHFYLPHLGDNENNKFEHILGY